jgi:hypothetical protein|nr:MAG TPA: transposase-like protein [Caudoviricetes sp.]DAZ58510.1 MAG TPA: transposase-like protein [Caudoviricetes sp.]
MDDKTRADSERGGIAEIGGQAMTREEAIECLKTIQRWTPDWDDREDGLSYWDAIDMALSALRPVSREQVEKAWRAHWIRCEDAQEGVVKYVCSHCFDYHAFREDFGEYTHNGNHPFCRKCGKAMTDEAVEMVMKRLEVPKDDQA